MIIRPEEDADHKAIFELTQLAFGQSQEALLMELFKKRGIYEKELLSSRK